MQLLDQVYPSVPKRLPTLAIVQELFHLINFVVVELTPAEGVRMRSLKLQCFVLRRFGCRLRPVPDDGGGQYKSASFTENGN